MRKRARAYYLKTPNHRQLLSDRCREKRYTIKQRSLTASLQLASNQPENE
ncbi:hypothetical protein [Calothrix sp. PCC 7507]|nr:hypothetical protein [Calothrix sp. PCC 7507]